jgi:hypothetical protein
MTEYRARIERNVEKTGIRAMNIFFASPNIVNAASEILTIAHTLGFCEDDVKQIVEVKETAQKPEPECSNTFHGCHSGYHDRRCPKYGSK